MEIQPPTIATPEVRHMALFWRTEWHKCAIMSHHAAHGIQIRCEWRCKINQPPYKKHVMRNEKVEIGRDQKQ